jgi:hypothetical protein
MWTPTLWQNTGPATSGVLTALAAAAAAGTTAAAALRARACSPLWVLPVTTAATDTCPVVPPALALPVHFVATASATRDVCVCGVGGTGGLGTCDMCLWMACATAAARQGVFAAVAAAAVGTAQPGLGLFPATKVFPRQTGRDAGPGPASGLPGATPTEAVVAATGFFGVVAAAVAGCVPPDTATTLLQTAQLQVSGASGKHTALETVAVVRECVAVATLGLSAAGHLATDLVRDLAVALVVGAAPLDVFGAAVAGADAAVFECGTGGLVTAAGVWNTYFLALGLAWDAWGAAPFCSQDGGTLFTPVARYLLVDPTPGASLGGVYFPADVLCRGTRAVTTRWCGSAPALPDTTPQGVASAAGLLAAVVAGVMADPPEGAISGLHHYMNVAALQSSADWVLGIETAVRAATALADPPLATPSVVPADVSWLPPF